MVKYTWNAMSLHFIFGLALKQTLAFMHTHEPGRECLTCGTELRGRTDKKFCDDYCRSAYNNKMGPRSSLYVRNVNS